MIANIHIKRIVTFFVSFVVLGTTTAIANTINHEAFQLEGYVYQIYKCPPCPPEASCKPCNI